MTSSSSSTQRIGFLTTSRADFGIQTQIIKKSCEARDKVATHILVSCSQLDEVSESSLRDSGLDGVASIFRLEGTKPAEDTWETAIQVIGEMGRRTFEAIESLGLSKLVLLGDRYEVLGAAYAAALSNAELVHIHGGEVTEGAVDEYMRHAISKLSNTHLVTSEEHRRRLLQMGEQPSRVHVVGPLGAENLAAQPHISRRKLELELGLKLSKVNILLAFHPETLLEDYGLASLKNILGEIDHIQDASILITASNADPGSERVTKLLQSFASGHRNTRFRENLGSALFANVLRQFDVVIGNSSSGLLEAPAFRTQVINVGGRQARRAAIGSVIDCSGSPSDIKDALKEALGPNSRPETLTVLSKGGSLPSELALRVLLENPIRDKIKGFYDLPLHALN